MDFVMPDLAGLRGERNAELAVLLVTLDLFDEFAQQLDEALLLAFLRRVLNRLNHAILPSHCDDYGTCGRGFCNCSPRTAIQGSLAPSCSDAPRQPCSIGHAPSSPRTTDADSETTA